MYRLIKKSTIWFSISGILILISIISLFTIGLKLGIDYEGGTVWQFTTSSNKTDKAVTTVMEKNNIQNYQFKENSDDEYSIKLPVLTTEEHNKITTAFKKDLNDYKETRYDTIGPTISKDLTNRSIWAVVLATIGIIIYIAYAFRRVPKPLSSWKFGLSAVVALIHDLLITAGFVAILGHFFSWMEVDALFITALLTIMGFSVHDTIVVYDRLRENFIKNPHQEIELTAEKSINQTIIRSLNTSVTVIIVLVALLLFGGESIRHFVLTLAFGILIGTYSSIFVAAPVLVRWHKKQIVPK